MPVAHAAHALEQGDEVALLAGGQGTGQHGAAGDQHRGDVQAHHGHEHAGHALVAVGDEDQGVEGMGAGHDLDGVGDELARRQGEAHAFVVHGDAVAHGDGGEFQGGAAGHAHTGLDGLGQLAQVQVAGHHFTGGVDHAHQRTFHFLAGQAQGIKQGTVRGLFQAGFHFFAVLFHDGILWTFVSGPRGGRRPQKDRAGILCMGVTGAAARQPAAWWR